MSYHLSIMNLCSDSAGGSFRGHFGVIPGSFRGHSGIIPGSFQDHSRVIPRSFRGHSSIIPGSFRAHSGIIPPSPKSLKNLDFPTEKSFKKFQKKCLDLSDPMFQILQNPKNVGSAKIKTNVKKLRCEPE